MTGDSANAPLLIDGVPVSAAWIASKLQQWSRLPPDPMAPDSAPSGHDRAQQLRSKLIDPLWRAEFDAALVDLLDGDLHAAWLAVALAPFGSLPPPGLDAAFEAAERHCAGLDWVDPGSQQMLHAIASHWQRAIASGALPFLPAYRDRLADPAATVLLGAALVWDHRATLGRLDELLGRGDDAVLRFGNAVRAALWRSEAQVLRTELNATQREAPTHVRGRCIDALTWYLEHDVLSNDGPVRWL